MVQKQFNHTYLFFVNVIMDITDYLVCDAVTHLQIFNRVMRPWTLQKYGQIYY